MVTVTDDGTIAFWRLKSPEVSFLPQNDVVNLVKFREDGATVAIARWDSMMLLLSDAGIKLFETRGHDHWIYDFAFSKDGRFFASGGHVGDVKIWDSAGNLIRHVESKAQASWVNKLAFSPDGKSLAIGWGNGLVEVLDVGNGVTQTLHVGHDLVSDLAFSPDGNSILASTRDGVIGLFSETGAPQWIADTGEAILAATFNETGDMITSFNAKGAIREWDSSGRARKTFETHLGARVARFGHQGRLLATAYGNVGYIWSADGTLLQVLRGHTDQIMGIDFNVEKGLIVTAGGQDRSIGWWRTDLSQRAKVSGEDIDLIVAQLCSRSLLYLGSAQGTGCK